MRASLALLSAYFSLAHLTVGVLSQPSAIGQYSEATDGLEFDGDLDLDVVDLPVYQPPYVRTATTASLQDWSSRTQRQRRLLHRSAASAEGAAAQPRSAERVACASNADCLKRGYPPLPQKPKTRHGPLRARQSACSPVQNRGLIQMYRIGGELLGSPRYVAEGDGVLGSFTTSTTSSQRLGLSFSACSTDPWDGINLRIVSTSQQTQGGAAPALPYLGMAVSANNTGSKTTLASGSSNAILLTTAQDEMVPGPAIKNSNLYELYSGNPFQPFEGAIWTIDKTRPTTGPTGRTMYPLILTWINPDGTSLQPSLYLNNLVRMFATPDLNAWLAAGNGDPSVITQVTLYWQS